MPDPPDRSFSWYPIQQDRSPSIGSGFDALRPNGQFADGAWDINADESDDASYGTFPADGSETPGTSAKDPNEWQANGWMIDQSELPTDARNVMYLPGDFDSHTLYGHVRAINSVATISQNNARLRGSLWWVNENDTTDHVRIVGFSGTITNLPGAGAFGAFGGTRLDADSFKYIGDDDNRIAPSRDHFLFLQMGLFINNVADGTVGNNSVDFELAYGEWDFNPGDDTRVRLWDGVRCHAAIPIDTSFLTDNEDVIKKIVKKDNLNSSVLKDASVAREVITLRQLDTSYLLDGAMDRDANAFRSMNASLLMDDDDLVKKVNKSVEASILKDATLDRQATTFRSFTASALFDASMDRVLDVFRSFSSSVLMDAALDRLATTSREMTASVLLDAALDRYLEGSRSFSTSFLSDTQYQGKFIEKDVMSTSFLLDGSVQRLLDAFRHFDADVLIENDDLKRVFIAVRSLSADWLVQNVAARVEIPWAVRNRSGGKTSIYVFDD